MGRPSCWPGIRRACSRSAAGRNLPLTHCDSHASWCPPGTPSTKRAPGPHCKCRERTAGTQRASRTCPAGSAKSCTRRDWTRRCCWSCCRTSRACRTCDRARRYTCPEGTPCTLRKVRGGPGPTLGTGQLLPQGGTWYAPTPSRRGTRRSRMRTRQTLRKWWRPQGNPNTRLATRLHSRLRKGGWGCTCPVGILLHKQKLCRILRSDSRGALPCNRRPRDASAASFGQPPETTRETTHLSSTKSTGATQIATTQIPTHVA